MNDTKNIINRMLQACKNIMFVTADYNMYGEIKKTEEVFDNIRTNVIVIIECFIMLDESTKNILHSNVEIKQYTDFSSMEYSFAALKDIFEFAKKTIPMHKTVLEKVLQNL